MKHVVQNHQTGEQMVKQRKFKFGSSVKHVPVRHLFSSLAIFVPRDHLAAKGPLVKTCRIRNLYFCMVVNAG